MFSNQGMFNNIYNNLNVLVTGHTGFKGAWLSYWLQQLGANVTGYSIDIPVKPSLFELLSMRDKIKHVQGDILHIEHLNKIYSQANPDIIFHLAAEPIVFRGYSHPRHTFMTNTLGTINILELARKNKAIKAIVIVTTDKCYDNSVSESDSISEFKHPYRESDKLGGSDPYSASKACCEIATHAYYSSFFIDSPTAVATARAGNVIGGGDWGEHRIVPDCMRAWSAQQAVVLRHPEATRPWQYVLDVLAGYLLLGEKLLNYPEKFTGEAYNFGPQNESYTTLALVKSLQKIWVDSQSTINSENSLLKEEQDYQLDSRKALKELGWQSSIDFHQIARLTAEWYWRYYHSPESIINYSLQQIENYHLHMNKENQCL